MSFENSFDGWNKSYKLSDVVFKAVLFQVCVCVWGGNGD